MKYKIQIQLTSQTTYETKAEYYDIDKGFFFIYKDKETEAINLQQVVGFAVKEIN